MANKSKGSDFERQLCVRFSEWWTNGKRDDVFWRTSMSGGRATIRKKKDQDTFGQAGDIQATDPIGQPLIDVFTIELKKGYSNESFANMLEKKEGAAEQTWEKFYHQVMEDRENSQSLSWLLIWQRDRKEPLVYTSPKIIKLLKMVGANMRLPYLKGKLQLKSGKKIMVFICRLEDFLKEIKPTHIKGVLRHARIEQEYGL